MTTFAADIAPSPFQFSSSSQVMHGTVLRDLLGLAQQTDVISFAGGFPSAQTFPAEAMRQAHDAVLSHPVLSAQALQYGAPMGYRPLREWIAESLSLPGSRIDADNVMITTGSQQGLALCGQTLLEKGARALVETPSYLGAIQAFSLSQPEFAGLESDAEGLLPDSLRAAGQGARMLYTLPTFQNPSGRTMSVARRQQVAALCADYSIPLVEDDPYSALSFDGTVHPRMLNMYREGTIYLGSFSKIMMPGIRLGYMVAPKDMIRRAELVKQCADLNTSSLTQMALHHMLCEGVLDTQLVKVRRFYAEQCQIMSEALLAHMPESVIWHKPTGGMFFWLQLPGQIDTMTLLAQAIQQQVAFVPGAPFYTDGRRSACLRLSFATMPPEKIRLGIERLAWLVRNYA